MLLLALLCAVGASVLPRATAQDNRHITDCDPAPSDVSLYQFTFKDVTEERKIPLRQFKVNVVLLVNVATYCDLTWTYLQLNALQERFSHRNFTVLAFPCNQFGKEEPGNLTDILNGIKYVRPGNGYTPLFPIFEKVEVNGENQHPLFVHLKSRCPSPQQRFAEMDKLFYSPQHCNDIRWNFEKFLIGVDGRPVKRYHATYPPEAITNDIEHLLESSGL